MVSPVTTTSTDTPLCDAGSEEKRQQLSRILNSTGFRNARVLQKFLEFVVAKSVEGNLDDLNEYSIATEILGRPQDFDPASDTSVRTQAYRLRTKLKEYYATEGKSDPLVIEIPKGHYVPLFSLRSEQEARASVASATPAEATVAAKTLDDNLRFASPRFRTWPVVLSLFSVAVLFFLCGSLIGSRLAGARQQAAATPKVNETLAKFWAVPSSEGGVVLAFTNPVFLETTTGDLLAYRGGAVADRGARVGREDSYTSALDDQLAKHAGPLYYEDGFTGTGEVFAVHRLTELLVRLNINLVLERTRSLSAADIPNHDVLILGWPSRNPILNEVSLRRRFTFRPPGSSPYLWEGEIVDNKTARSYHIERNPETQVILADYALFEVLPSPAPGHRIVVFAGLTTTGTEGATAFATSSEGLRQVGDLVGSTKVDSGSLPASFECLLRADAVRGLDALKVNAVACSSL